MITPLLALVLALIPGAISWWTGRRILRTLDDAALPELLMARRQRSLSVLAFCIVFLVAFGGRHAFWAVPLQVIALLVGSFPLGRVLLGESTSLPVYVWRALRSVIAGFGFWLAVGSAPLLVVAFGRSGWPGSLVLLALLLAWEHWYTWLWLRLHDARPIDDPELVSRIQAIVAKAGIQAPATYRIGAPGARLVTAVALPSARRPAVAMGNALIELLEPDETAAIFAHELAHIEQFTPRVVRRIQLVNRLLVVGAIMVPFVGLVVAPQAMTWVLLGWPIVELLVLARRGVHRQRHETESDLRAAALCGDPELVVSALIKLHVHAFIPRRWPVDFERRATHPSLARRIQALRGDGPQVVASLGAPAVVTTAREGTLVVLDNARAYWFDGIPSDAQHDLETLRNQASGFRSVRYEDLLELRVVASDSGRALRATHRNGDAWSVPLEPSQVNAVQKALDVVDVRLHGELGRRTLITPRFIA